MMSLGEWRDALVIIAPAELSGQAFPLEAEHLTIGRADDNDVRLQDPYVSRRHAVVHRAGNSLVIEDTGSRGGFTINGVAVGSPCFLRDGDVIGIGNVQLRVACPNGRPHDPSDVTLAGQAAADSRARPYGGPAPVPPPSAGRQFSLESQRAGAISNVAGNQYNIEALRILGPMRRRARWVLRTGLTMIALGFVVAAIGEIIWRNQVSNCLPPTAGFSCVDNTTGLAVAQYGGVVLGLGVIVLIVSLFMRREVRKQEARM
jgi:Inner membrane component of T3SS, cytoplasmic domain